MAGMGSRFIKASYRTPKPFIPIMGLPMYVAVIKSFPLADKYIFICQEEFLNKYPFEEETKKRFSNEKIYSVQGITEGQACTCLIAEEDLINNEELLISSIDYQIVYDEDEFNRMRYDKSVDVIIFTFQTKSIMKKDPNAFAYCRTDKNQVVEVVEKRTISEKPELDPAVVGSFYYKRAIDFVRSAKKMIEKNIRINNEFYVGTAINQLIEEGLNVKVFPVKKFISFGDPFELEIYQCWEDYFFNEKSHPYDGWKRNG